MGLNSTWPNGQATHTVKRDSRRSVRAMFDSLRVISVNFTYALVLVQVILSFQYVRAGPVVFNMEYSQGPVPLARNIRHLPCISRKTAQEGMCMFAIDCLKANGTHLGTCIDRFYFGSCCQIPDKTILPQIIGNHIDDNSIDGASFVHPQTEDKYQKPVNSIFPIRKTTTEKTETINTTASIDLETKSDDEATIDNKISNDEKVTVEMTTKEVKVEIPVTDVPIKLSTFQTVSAESSSRVTEKIDATVVNTPEVSTTTVATSTVATSAAVSTSPVTLRPKPTRKPTRPSSFTRPTYKPYNITRPQYTQSTFKPKPTKPVLNTTRKPPYRLPPKRPSTKKPLPLPPRLNITILPQSTSSKPLFTRPQSVSITYINTTQVSTTKEDPKDENTSTSTTTTEKVLTTEKVEKVVTTEKVVETTELIPETIFLTTESVTEKVERTTATESPVETIPTESSNETTIEEDVTEKDTVRPMTEADIPEVTTTSTEYPPFMTWSSNTDVVTKKPEIITEAPTTTTTEDTWSPITPPEGWILLSTIAPKPETTLSTSTTEPPTEPATEPQDTTVQPTETAEKETEAIQTIAPEPTTTQSTTQITTSSTTTAPITTSSTSNAPITTSPTTTTPITTSPTTTAPITTSSTTTAPITTSPTTTAPVTTISTTTSSTTTSTVETTSVKATEKVPETTQAIQEFTVNVTLSPTVPTTTSSSVTVSNNDTKGNESSTSTTESITSAEVESTTNATTVETTTETVNMSDYKNVCGRRLWQAPTGRIVGGAKSGFGMWPWQISLRQYRTSTYLHKCGAALLNENWAITAAHCVEHVPPSELLVRLGEHDLANEDEPYGFAERRVQIVASHPHFDPATFEYDLALLRFYEPVTFQPNILPVCVPDDDEDYVGKTAYVTGWGRLFDEGPLPSVLQEVKVPVINNSACEAMYQAAGYNEHIPNIFICAGRSKGGTDSCEGDSGGPMVLPRERDGRYVLGGVISWGIGCAEPNQPGVYTRISEFRDWINQILQF